MALDQQGAAVDAGLNTLRHLDFHVDSAARPGGHWNDGGINVTASELITQPSFASRSLHRSRIWPRSSAALLCSQTSAVATPGAVAQKCSPPLASSLEKSRLAPSAETGSGTWGADPSRNWPIITHHDRINGSISVAPKRSARWSFVRGAADAVDLSLPFRPVVAMRAKRSTISLAARNPSACIALSARALELGQIPTPKVGR